MTKRKTIPEPVAGYGYVGLWRYPEEELGWSMPRHMYPIERSESYSRRGTRSNMNDSDWAVGEDHYLCRITIGPVLDSLDRPIIAVPKRREEK